MDSFAFPLLLISFGFSMFVCGCGFKNVGNFEDGVQRHVGFDIASMKGSPNFREAVRLGDGMMEYRYEKPSGCKWAYLVDQGGIIVSWRYLSPADPCALRPSWGAY